MKVEERLLTGKFSSRAITPGKVLVVVDERR